MIRLFMVGVAVAVAVTPTSAQSTIRGSERKPAVGPRRATSVRISVRDRDRAMLAGVRIAATAERAGKDAPIRRNGPDMSLTSSHLKRMANAMNKRLAVCNRERATAV